MRLVLSRFLDDTRGATAIEYGLIAALVALIVIGCFTVFAGSLANVFSATTARVTAAIGAG
ncbi:MAG: Flp family type IVb pilin [Pseudomonadota bacterium]|nr:Flp family type IVb pilin [Pseudomonadota bacterium]